MIKEIKINNMEQLIRLINEFPNNYIYRGQANSQWKLTSSLERIIGNCWNNIKKFEEHSLEVFQPKFHLYGLKNHTPSSKLAWLSLMQHYGTPTRLLDFTESPYVALYFALETFDYKSDDDLALYAIDYCAIIESSLRYIKEKDNKFNETMRSIQGKQDKIFEYFIDRFSYNIIWITEPAILNARMDRQLGSFLLSGNKEKRIEDILYSDLYSNTDIKKIIIPNELGGSIYALLRKMNLTSKNLYGDLEGLAKSVRMEMLVYSSP